MKMTTEPEFHTKDKLSSGAKPEEVRASAAELPPWERLELMARELQGLQGDVRGKVHPLAVVDGVLELGEGSEVKAGTVIEGYVRIGRGCRIGPNAYLRGPVSIGDDCVIGHAVEVKSSLIGDRVSISHLSYIGDSVLGSDINVGGGCIFSNFRHDAGEIRMMWQGKLRPTGLHKLGCLIGDQARIGCKSVILPGRVVPAGAQTHPGDVIR